MDIIRLIIGFYNAYREDLGYDHDKAMNRVEYMYDDIHEWLYEN